MDQPECTLIIGPSGCGKTYTLLNSIIEIEYKNKFDFIVILCPTIWINQSYTEWKYLNTDIDVIGLEVSPEKLDMILKYLIDVYSGSKIAIIVDDMSNSNEQHQNNTSLAYLAYSGRHHNISLFIVSQKLNSIATGIRDNTTRVIFFKTHNKRSLKILRDEFFGYLRDDDAERDILKKLNAHKYLDINLTGQPSYVVK